MLGIHLSRAINRLLALLKSNHVPKDNQTSMVVAPRLCVDGPDLYPVLLVDSARDSKSLVGFCSQETCPYV